MKLWIDGVRPAPEGFHWCQSVNEAITAIRFSEDALFVARPDRHIEVIDINNDEGDYDYYIEVLNWLEATGRSYPIHIHSMNPVGVERMRAIIERNGWEEV